MGYLQIILYLLNIFMFETKMLLSNKIQYF